MVRFSQICVAFAAAAGTRAAPATANHGPLTLFTELKQQPSMWKSEGAADKGAMITAQIGLKQSNIPGLQAKLLDISNPENPNYGKWLSQEEIAAFTAPAAGNVEAVKAWLAANDIMETTQPTNEQAAGLPKRFWLTLHSWIEFTVPIHQMETLLDAEYQWFAHITSDIKVPRTTKYSIPQGLHSVIDMITPTTAFYNNMGAHAQEIQMSANTIHSRASGCKGDGSIQPSCINSIYNVDYISNGSQLVGTTGLLGIGANHEDYASFGQAYVPGLKDFQDVTVGNGPNSGNGSALEGNLDTQHMGGISHPNPSVYISAGPIGGDAKSFNDAISNIASYLSSTSNPPSVVSTSCKSASATVPYSRSTENFL